MRFHDGRLFTSSFSLCFTQLLDQTSVLTLQATLNFTAYTRTGKLDEFFGGQAQELLKVNATVRVFAESALLLLLSIVSLNHRTI